MPVDAASESRAVASAWIAASPPILDVLDWHRGLCPACTAAGRCAERAEIVDEYGAGPYGASVFWPAAT